VTPARAVTVCLYVTGVVVGGLLAVVTAVFVPTRAGVASLGVAAVVAMIGPYVHFFGRGLRSPLAGAVPAVGWFLVAMVLAGKRPEGDLVITGSAYGLAYLLLGTVSAAVGIGTVRAALVRADVRAAERAPEPD